MRIESPKLCKNGGWLHALGDTTKLRPLPPKPERPAPTIDAAALMRGFGRGSQLSVLGLAESLGVSPLALTDLGCVWAVPYQAFAFPMRDWTGAIVGIRLRYPDCKRAVKGSRNGLFYAPGEAKRWFITEGESDTAAGLTIGLQAIGRPGCMSLEQECDRLLKRKKAREVVIVADSDDAGQRGAEKLQAALSIPSCIFYPPSKDLRQMVQLGGTAQLIDSLTRSLVWHVPKREACV